MAKEKTSQSEIDGVVYRRAKLWQIIANACNTFVAMSAYTLIGMANYSASLGFGISTAIIGIILTGTRILDGVTDPLLAFVYDKVNTRFGKIRILLLSGFVIEVLALMAMFVWLPGKGLGVLGFSMIYVVYVIGYTAVNMTAQTIPPLLTNDPQQRPLLGVWNTAFNYMVPMILTIVLNVILLPKFGGEYNLAFLSTACKVCLAVSLFGIILVCIGVSHVDKPENFEGLTAKKEPLRFKDMADVLKGNKPLQCYIISAASDKIAQQTASQSVITTLLNGILIGNMSLATILTVIGMFPSILFAVVGAKQAGKIGAKETIVKWTRISTVFAILTFLFFVAIDPSEIADMGLVTVMYVLLTLCLNGAKMCITTANTSFMSDLVDYELDRSGRYIPAVVSGTYSFLDKLISSCGAAIAAGAVALVGYTNTVPQPGDPSSPAIFWLTMAIVYGLPILGWICTLVAMKFCDLDRQAMVDVQKRIAQKKEQLKKEQENT